MTSPEVVAQIGERMRKPGFLRWAEQVARCGNCAHPVRLVGSTTTLDASTGEILSSYRSGDEPDGVTYIRCGNRRATVCPSCSAEYKGDMWHLLVAGATGGIKGVPEQVRTHPLVFATLTAPSFGPVHAHKKPGRKGTSRCRPRTGGKLCPHGRPTWCMRTHDRDDPQVGQPLCPDCYDYTGQVIWQWWAPMLWRLFTIALRRHLAHHLGVSRTRVRDLVRVQFAKVAEYQRRGVIHFHALIRLDGPPVDGNDYPAPDVDITAENLCKLVHTAAAAVSYNTPADDRSVGSYRLRLGHQVDARVVHDHASRDDAGDGDLHPETVAAYVAKYATKATDDLDPGHPGTLTTPHVRRLRATVDRLADHADTAGGMPYALLGKWRHMLGFRGHFATKSRHYSVTLGALRQERRTYRARGDRRQPAPTVNDTAGDDAEVDSTLVVGSWQFAGMGWLTDGDAALAAAAAAHAREHRQQQAAARRLATAS